MEIFISTIDGTLFAIAARPHDTVEDFKKNIGFVLGEHVYHASQPLLHEGKFLKDGTTLEDNNVEEHDLVIIYSKALKLSDGSTSATAPPAAVNSAPPPPVTSPTPAASDLRARRQRWRIEEIYNMGAGVWDRETVGRALRAGFNQPNRTIKYLYWGIPKRPVAKSLNNTALSGNSTAQAQPAFPVAVPNCGPNASSLSLSPQGLPNKGSNYDVAARVDVLRKSVDLLRKSRQEKQLGKAVPHAIQVTSEVDKAIERGLPNKDSNPAAAGTLDCLRNNQQIDEP